MPKLSESDRKDLERNPNVLKVTGSNVAYTPEFKIKAVKAFIDGDSPEDIFKAAKLQFSSSEDRYASRSIRRWKKIYEEEGEDGLRKEKRGKKSRGRPKKNFKSLEDENRYLRMEIYLLKKLRALAASKKKNGSR